MKFGICSEIFKDWNDIDRTVDFVRECGYDGIEIAPFTMGQYVYDIPQTTRDHIRAKAESAGLEVAGIHWVLVGPDNVHVTHPDQAIRDRTSDYLVELVRFCSDIGGKVIVFGSPKQRNVHESITLDQAYENARSTFGPALRACEQHDVTICMEQLAPTETNFCQTVDETLRFIDMVGHDRFRLILDTKAMTQEQEDRPTLIRKAARHLAHYHANDANLNGPGWGDVDFRPIFDALRDIDYRGYVSVEVFDFEPGPEAIAEKSLRYMREASA